MSMEKNGIDMLYLCGCVLKGELPQKERLEQMDFRALLSVSRFQSLAAIVAEALEMMPLPLSAEESVLSQFRDIKAKSVRKNLLFDFERQKLFSFMEENGIWYMPLKGIVLKDLYPKMGLRQMADNDILFDCSYRTEITKWFVKRGYEAIAGNGNHDVYKKEPVYNYEMHVSLYGESHPPVWVEYYRNVKERLCKDEGNDYGYHFTDEDFYIYFLSHGFKHYDHSGTGVRFLLDFYVLLQKKSLTMDWEKIQKELPKLGLEKFERECRELVEAVFTDIQSFSMEKLSKEQEEMLKYFISNGTYGTMKNAVMKKVKAQGKYHYLLERLFRDRKLWKNIIRYLENIDGFCRPDGFTVG